MMAGPVRLFAMHGSETPGKGSSVSMAGAGLSIGTMDATKSDEDDLISRNIALSGC